MDGVVPVPVKAMGGEPPVPGEGRLWPDPAELPEALQRLIAILLRSTRRTLRELE
jgi:hypothetical protein